MRERLAGAIDQLPERERLVVTLYYYEEMTMKEIGLALGVVESRVSQIHSSAVVHLRARLPEFGAGPEIGRNRRWKKNSARKRSTRCFRRREPARGGSRRRRAAGCCRGASRVPGRSERAAARHQHAQRHLRAQSHPSPRRVVSQPRAGEPGFCRADSVQRIPAAHSRAGLCLPRCASNRCAQSRCCRWT